MQIATSQLLAKDDAVTRSTVQKAVVVLAAKPAFGPIRYVFLSLHLIHCGEGSMTANKG
jgi:hypothetical protein